MTVNSNAPLRIDIQQSQVIADLIWLIRSPSLFGPSQTVPCISSGEYKDWYDNHCHWLFHPTFDVNDLWTFINTSRRYRLGLYAEDLIRYFLLKSPQFDLLAHDLQIFENKESVGALDFIVRLPDGSVEHWEMAMKYFLQYSPSSNWRSFIGPDGKDTLERKMKKMLDRQIHLCRRPAAIEQLSKKGIPIPSKRRILSLGRFFQAWGQKFVAPKSGDKNQPTGTWIRQAEFAKYTKSCKSLWKIRIHPDWLAPFMTSNQKELMDGPQISSWSQMNLVQQTDYAMLSEMMPCEDTWKEIHRWIVVADKWEKINGQMRS